MAGEKGRRLGGVRLNGDCLPPMEFIDSSLSEVFCSSTVFFSANVDGRFGRLRDPRKRLGLLIALVCRLFCPGLTGVVCAVVVVVGTVGVVVCLTIFEATVAEVSSRSFCSSVVHTLVAVSFSSPLV